MDISLLQKPVFVAVIAIVLLAAALGMALQARHSYTKKPLLNFSERKLLAGLEEIVTTLGEYRVFCQVSYGEFLHTKRQKSFWRINAKRADFVIVDAEFLPVAVVEYQGAGHWGSTRSSARAARDRDVIKRRACESASIAWIEIPARYAKVDLHAALVSVLGQELQVGRAG